MRYILLLLVALLVSGCTVFGVEARFAGFGIEAAIKVDHGTTDPETEEPKENGLTFRLFDDEQPPIAKGVADELSCYKKGFPLYGTDRN